MKPLLRPAIFRSSLRRRSGGGPPPPYVDYDLQVNTAGNFQSTDGIALITAQANGSAEVQLFDGVHTILKFGSSGATIELGLTGMSSIGAYLPSILGNNPSAGFVVKLNGAVQTPTYLPANTYGLVTLASGMNPAAVYNLELAFTGAGGNCYIERTAGGGAHASFRGFGPNPQFLFPPNRGMLAMAVVDSPLRICADGGYQQSTLYAWPCWVDGYTGTGAVNARGGFGSMIRGTLVVAAGGNGGLRMFCKDGNFLLSWDNGATWVGPVDCNSPGSWAQWTTLGAGRPVGNNPFLIVNANSSGTNPGNNNPAAVMAMNGTFLANAASVRARMDCYGDSLFTNFGTGVPVASAPAVLYQVSNLTQPVPLAFAVRSIPGSKVQSISGAAAGENDTANITGAVPLALRVFVPYGGNDDISGGTVALQASYNTMITALGNGCPDSIVYLPGPFPSGSQTPTVRAQKNTCFDAAVAAVNLPNLIRINTETCGLDPSGPPYTDTVDGTHFSAAGGVKVNNWMLSEMWTPDRFGTDLLLWLVGRSGQVFKSGGVLKCADGDECYVWNDRRTGLIAGVPVANRQTAGLSWVKAASGMKCNAVSASYLLNAPITWTGPYTLYAVGFYVASNTNWVPLARSDVNEARALFNNGNMYTAGLANQVVYTGAVNQEIIATWRRDAANMNYVAATGMAETNAPGTAGAACRMDLVGSWPAASAYTTNLNTHSEIILVRRDTKADGTHTNMLNYLKQMHKGLTL
jgi:hypothetical protein